MPLRKPNPNQISDFLKIKCKHILAKQKILLSCIGQNSAGKNQCSPAEHIAKVFPIHLGWDLPLLCRDCHSAAARTVILRHRGVSLHTCTLRHIQKHIWAFRSAALRQLHHAALTSALTHYRGLKTAKKSDTPRLTTFFICQITCQLQANSYHCTVELRVLFNQLSCAQK